jgi:hypothetical protein
MASLKIAVLAFVPLLAVGCRGIPTSGASPSQGTSTSVQSAGTSTAAPAPGTSAPSSAPVTSAPAGPSSPVTSPPGLPSSPSLSSGPTQPPSQPPAPAPSSSSPSAPPSSPASWAWCSSAALGTENVSGGFDLYNNEWNTAADPGPQTICGNSAGDWQVTSSQGGSDPTEVKTYPSVQKNYPNEALSQFSSMTSSYAESMPATGDFEAAYDIWVNGLSKEIMFWVDNHGQTPSGSKLATVTFGGSTWNLYGTGGYWAFVLNHNAPSGTVDLLGGLRYLQSTGALSASDQLWQVNFGWEICSTGNQPETFHMTSYSLASS